MAWIESHTVLVRHRKLIELAEDLKIRRAYAMGHLHALWHAAIEQQEDGDLSTWSDKMIAEAADFSGDPKRLIHSLKLRRWIDRNRRIHDWWDYAGPFLRSKYKRTPEKWERVRNLYVTVTATVTQPSNRPNRTVPNLTQPTEPERTGDGFAENGQTAKTLIAESAILMKPWHFKGQFHMVRINDLPADYCEWAIKNLTKLTAEERLGCEIIIKRKTQETSR